MLYLLIFVLTFAILGTFTGTVTGLTPGLHVNTVALILLGISSALLSFLSAVSGIPFYFLPLLLAVYIVSTSIAHTFLDFVPSTFLGVPEADTALSVLPAHRLVLEGRGYHAVYLSAIGSALAVVFGFCLLIPFALILGEPLNLYPLLRDSTLLILLFLVGLLIATETARIRGSRVLGVVTAFCVFLLSGVLGLVVLPLPSASPFGFTSTVLFPLFSGLFGLSTLLLSLRASEGNGIPVQNLSIKPVRPEKLRAAASGTVAGSIVGFLPGISSAHAALIALLPGRKGDDANPESVILTLGAVNTSNALFVLAALFLTGRARSGAASAAMNFLPLNGWNFPLPLFLALLLIAVLFTSVIAFFLTLIAGRLTAEHINRVPYRKLVWGIVAFITVLVFAFNGFLGFFILLVSIFVGMIPPLVGVRRSHLMGVLLLSVILYLM